MNDEKKGLSRTGAGFLGVIVGIIGSLMAFTMMNKKDRQKVEEKLDVWKKKATNRLDEWKEKAEQEKDHAQQNLKDKLQEGKKNIEER